MEGGTYAEEAEAEDWQLIFALDAVRRTETHANTGGMLMPVVLAGAEPTIIRFVFLGVTLLLHYLPRIPT